MSEFNNSFEKKDIEDNKVMAILSYIGILVLIPIFAAKESKYARYHANQGLILLIVEVVLSVISGIFGAIVPFLGTVVGTVISLISLALMIIGIINAAKGEAKELPYIGKYTIIK